MKRRVRQELSAIMVLSQIKIAPFRAKCDICLKFGYHTQNLCFILIDSCYMFLEYTIKNFHFHCHIHIVITNISFKRVFCCVLQLSTKVCRFSIYFCLTNQGVSEVNLCYLISQINGLFLSYFDQAWMKSHFYHWLPSLTIVL